MRRSPAERSQGSQPLSFNSLVRTSPDGSLIRSTRDRSDEARASVQHATPHWRHEGTKASPTATACPSSAFSGTHAWPQAASLGAPRLAAPVAPTSSSPLNELLRAIRWMSAGGTAPPPPPRAARRRRHAASPTRSTSPPSLNGPASWPACMHVAWPISTRTRKRQAIVMDRTDPRPPLLLPARGSDRGAPLPEPCLLVSRPRGVGRVGWSEKGGRRTRHVHGLEDEGDGRGGGNRLG